MMKEKNSNKIENTELVPIRKEEPVEETKLRHCHFSDEGLRLAGLDN